jgi:glycerol-3-phosphate O-acyltransferase/dihydroxyacetone phosphate acyltransferase
VSAKKAKEALAGSSVKIAGKDVIATWKLMTALIAVPLVFVIYTLLAYFISGGNLVLALVVLASLPLMSLGSLLLSDQAFAAFLRLYPLYLSVVSKTRITQTREVLSQDIQRLINELGPQVLKDFESNRVISKDELLSSNDSWTLLDEDDLLEDLLY